MARKTSFYYSFLVLPRDQRQAIVAVWDFCRVVDDAVDEHDGRPGSPPPREAIRFWRAELARAFDDQTPLTMPSPLRKTAWSVWNPAERLQL